MRMRNFGTISIKLAAIGLGKGEVAPGECVELPDHVCKPHRTAGGGRGTSIVEDLCGGNLLQPDDDDERETWLGVPELPKPAKKPGKVPTVEEIMAREKCPRGVAELIVAEQAARAHGVELHKALEGELRPMQERAEQRERSLHERVDGLTMEHERQLGALREAHAGELQGLRGEHERQLGTLREQHERALAGRDETIAGLRAQLEAAAPGEPESAPEPDAAPSAPQRAARSSPPRRAGG